MKLSKFFLSAIAATTLAACGNLSKITEDGYPVGDTPEQALANLAWPKIDESTFNHDGSQFGSWPNWSSVRTVERGMNKDQIANLLGRPHFSEGFFGVREWDYAFNYREKGVHKICQYKVLFDKNMNAQSFFWFPNGCNGNSSFVINGSFLFDFDTYVLSTKGKEIVDGIAAKLKSSNAKDVQIEGHSDIIGTEEYNLQLSQRRADMVKARLVEQGVTANLNAIGFGESRQIKTCPESYSAKQLEDCLKPNRRVEIKASGTVSIKHMGSSAAGTTGPAVMYKK